MTVSSPTLNSLRESAVAQLTEAGVDAPGLTAEVLLAHALDIDRARLLARLDTQPVADQLSSFQTVLQRVAGGEPLAYVVGHREFYDLDLLTDRRALIPRPETECLVERAIQLLANQSAPLIADIGTGCGTIAVTLAKHLPQARVIATDLSPDAIELARSNARRHQVEDRIEFRAGDVLEPIHETLDLLAANLPYINDRDWPFLAQTIRGHEPRAAFLGGPDGLDLIRRLLHAAPRCVRPGSLILLEISAYQGDDIKALAQRVFPTARISIEPDYAGLDRLAVIEVRE